MRSDDRALVDEVLRRARTRAYGRDEFVGQENFMRASEILALASEAGIGSGVSVLDLCCGVAGPGRFVTAALGCTYLGVDLDSAAIDVARERAGGLPCRFEVSPVPPVPAGPFDVVMLLETLLAFPDKQVLLEEISRALPVGGRFAFTLEEGEALTERERASMPNADTVWLMPMPHVLACLDRVGFRVRWRAECTQAHWATVDSLVNALAAEEPAIAARLGRGAFEDLLTAHRLWSDWLLAGRVRKFAFVAEKT